MSDKATATLYLIQSHEGMNLDLSPLAEPQRLKAKRLSGKRKTEFSLGRLLLTNALNTSKNVESRIIEQEQGPPLLESDGYYSGSDPRSKTLQFSISHSKGWVGLIFCMSTKVTELGLDIEKVKPDLSEKQASYFCNPHQIQAAQSLTATEKSEYFTRLWTHKEAFCKSQGLSVLSKQSKAADFKGDKRMRSAQLNGQYFVSVYSNASIAVETQFLTLGNDGNLIKDDTLTLNWESEPSAC